MKWIAKAAPLLAAAAVYLDGQAVLAKAPVAVPDIISVFAPQVTDAKTKLGQDGNLRLIWDFTPGPTTYSGSALWLFDGLGNFISVGSPFIPANIGYDIVPSAHSNVIVYGQADGNTTLAFLYPSTPGANPLQIGTWTYNSAGALIASTMNGPFTGTTAHQVFFDELSGQLVIQWRTLLGKDQSVTSVWTLNEFGAVVTDVGPFGPYGVDYTRGKTQLVDGIDQVWFWDVNIGGGHHELTIWRFNPAGFIINAQTYNPY
jgi:hypothetical protein